MPIEKKIELLTAFGLFDNQHQGDINTNELGIAIQKLGYKLSEEDIGEIVKEVDNDNSGSIDFEEFAQLMENKMKDNDSEEEIQESFKIFDKKNRGAINKDDIKHVLENLHERVTQADLDAIFAKYDIDQDGFLNFSEYKSIYIFYFRNDNG